jgi:NADH-quinone oxidoreductase subunit N
VFLAAVDAGLSVLAIAGAIASVIGAFYYIRIIKIIYFDDVSDALDGRMSRAHRLALGLAALVMGVGWLPLVDLFGLVEFSGAAAASLLQ